MQGLFSPCLFCLCRCQAIQGMRCTHLASFKHCVIPHLKPIQSMPEVCVMQNDVGMFRVDAKQLKTALLPSPTALLAQLGQCLPRAAAQLYAAFVDQVHSATSILKASISSVEDYVQQLAFLETLKVGVVRTCVSQLSAAVVSNDNVTASCRTMLVLSAQGFLQCTSCFLVRVWRCCSL